MRILFCNKYNFAFSGTEVYLFGLMDLLRSHGHEVALFSMTDARGEPTQYDRHFVPHLDFKQPVNFWQKMRKTMRVIYSHETRRRIAAMIADFRPDVAHVRNIYHHLSPSILWELKKRNIPVIYHLNDFKLLCPSYNLVSQGQACEACKGGAFRKALTTECYPGKSARAVLVAEAYAHKWLGTYRKCVSRFLAPSQFVRDKFVEHGWDEKKFEVLPHFQVTNSVDIKAIRTSASDNAPILYFGRLSPEKGVNDLLHAMQSLRYLSLVIAGEGPQRNDLQQRARELKLSNVEFKGQVKGSELERLIAQSRFTVLPSHAYETFGKSILESYAHGRAVIATDLGSRRELVREGQTGLLYPTGNVEQLASAIESLASQPELAKKMGDAAYELVQHRHKPEAHYATLMDLYQRVIAENDAMKNSTRNRIKRTKVFARSLIQQKQNPRLSVITAPAPETKLTVMAEKKLRIAFIGGRGVVGKYSGIETYYEEVGNRLARMGHEVTVYCRNYFTPAAEEHRGMKLVYMPTVRSKHLETLVHTILSTLHAMTQHYDIVHYHTLGPALFSWLPRLLGQKTAVTVQGLDWQRKKWGWLAARVLKLGESASAHLPNGTMVVSQTLQQRYRERHGVETFYVPNGGLLRERTQPRKILEWGLEPDKYILFLGRFSPEKGCHLLIEAYEQLYTDVKLVMAGPASYCDDYTQQLRKHAGEKIKLLDPVSGETLDELLTNAMIFVLPSDLEGLSLALLDAMGAGLCVLASDVPENQEVVHGAGFTFLRGDANDLARQLQFFMDHPAARAEAGKAAKKRIVEQYLWPQIATQIEEVYYKVMRSKGPTALHKKTNRSILQEMATEKETRAQAS